MSSGSSDEEPSGVSKSMLVKMGINGPHQQMATGTAATTATVPSPYELSGETKMSASASRKRQKSSDEDEIDGGALQGDGTFASAASSAMALTRSERKRQREKKRRSDVNKGFDELMTLLLEIDPDVRAEAEERARRGQWKGQCGAQEDNLLSRVDLISRTIDVIRRLHRENEERKEIIASLTGQIQNRREEQASSLLPSLASTEQTLARRAALARSQLYEQSVRDLLLNASSVRDIPQQSFLDASASSLSSGLGQDDYTGVLSPVQQSLLERLTAGRSGHGDNLRQTLFEGLSSGRQAAAEGLGRSSDGASTRLLEELALAQTGGAGGGAGGGRDTAAAVAAPAGGDDGDGLAGSLARRYLELLRSRESTAAAVAAAAAAARLDLKGRSRHDEEP